MEIISLKSYIITMIVALFYNNKFSVFIYYLYPSHAEKSNIYKDNISSTKEKWGNEIYYIFMLTAENVRLDLRIFRIKRTHRIIDSNAHISTEN